MAHHALLVPIPCPSRKHQESIVTFRDHTVAAMFCVGCETAWTETTSHPALVDLPVTDFRDSRRQGE